MAHLQYMPGDPRLVDQLVYELKSKGIFDQFRKDCIADVDTRPAYQNLRQRVENSVSSFLARQVWKPDLNKNQLREKLRKHILDGNYLEQGVERIVDQVVNPKLATVFVPKVEDLVYDYLGITRKKNSVEASNGITDLLPTDLEAVSPGSVKSTEDKDEAMEVDEMNEPEQKNEMKLAEVAEKMEEAETSGVSELTVHDSDGSDDKDNIPLPAEEIRPEDIPPPENSPPKIEKVELEKIELPKEPDVATDIPLPDEIPKQENGTFFKTVNSDDDSSSDSSLRRNMSPLTPIRSYNNENSCDAQQAFENQLIESKKEEITEPSTFRFALDTKSTENSLDAPKLDHKNETDLSYKLNLVNINNFVTPAYEDSSNSNNLQIDYESDANSKVNTEIKAEQTDQNSEDSKKEKKSEEKKGSHKSSHRSREHKHSANKDKKSESKPSSSRDTSRHDKKSKDDGKHKSSEKEKSRDRSDRKENKDSSRHKSSHKSSHKDSKSHRSSSSSHKHSSRSDEKKSSSTNQKDKDKNSDKSSSKDKYSKDSKSSSHLSDRDKKSSSSTKSRSGDKDKDKKSKKDTDDHYSLSGRGNPNRRSTDRDSNDGSSSSKGSHRPSSSKSSESKKDSKESTSKSDNTSGSGSTTPSDKEAPHDAGKKAEVLQNKPIVRLETHLETPVSSPPRLPFVPDITLKKPKIAANFEEAKKIMKMRKFLEEEQRRMNQEAALLLEFQANVRPSLSQVYSSIPGPELEFACNTNTATQYIIQNSIPGEPQSTYVEEKTYTNAELYEELNAGNETRNDIEEVHGEQKTVRQKIKACEIPSESEKTSTTQSSDLSVSEIKEKSNVFKGFINLSEIKSHEKDTRANKIKSRELCKNEESLKINKKGIEKDKHNKEMDEKDKLCFFAEYEKYNSELEKTEHVEFLKLYIEKTNLCNKLYLINCDTYEENVVKDVASTFGDYEIISYHRNGQLKMPKTKAIVKNLNLTAEVSLPIDSESRSNDSDIKCQVFSPGKSDCSFELSYDYDAKLEEMVNKTSRKEIMQIILGDIIDGSPSKMPKIDYITESNIDSAIDCNLKRKINDSEATENNNRPVLTPHKIRKMSTSELITSTTQDTEEPSNDKLTSVRSKYLGRAKRVGLPQPKRTELPNSPSSDKSVENYEQNTPTKTNNGKVKAPRHLVQRYETSDLYKPKLHFLSRRNVS